LGLIECLSRKLQSSSLEKSKH